MAEPKPKTPADYRVGSRSKVFRTGGSLAIRLPKEFHPEESEVMITKVAEGLLITAPPVPPTVAGWWASWDADPLFMADGRQQPAMQARDFDH